MTAFAVWAPRALSVELLLGAERRRLRACEAGWWRLDAPEVGAGHDYAFSLDGGPALPDPRSRWQPAGIDAPSRVLDLGAFPWTDAGWQPPALESGLVYELHVGTFSPEGTFEGVARRLDHLCALGVTHVELMPVATFPGARGWGYDGVGLFAPHEAYGGPLGLARLVDACHARGLAVLLDVVYNHLGPSGNHLARFGPYFTDRYRTPWGPALNFDGPDSDDVRGFFVDNARTWLRDYHLDGLRLDAVHAIVDTSALHILEELAQETAALSRELGRRLVLVAESDANDPRLVVACERGGYGLDAVWNDDFHHALHALLSGERSGYYADFGSVADLARAYERGFVYDGRYSRHRRRHHGRAAPEAARARMLAFLQNHDQVGNRARGERSAALLPPELLYVGAALLLFAPYVPLLFQGEEWGAATPFLYFTDHRDPELARAVREGRRREFAAFGWRPEDVPDPQALESFARSRLDWGEPTREPHRALLEWHRALARLRRDEPDLRGGRRENLRVAFDESARWFSVQRGAFTLLCNLAEQSHAVPLAPDRERCVWLASPGAHRDVGASAVVLAPRSALITGPDRKRARPAGVG